jgi:hypothetical protein
MHACAGAFSGTGLAKQISDTFLRLDVERAHRADVVTIQMAGSFSECMAKDVPWQPQDGGDAIV